MIPAADSEQCRHPAGLVAPPSGGLPPGRPLVVECRDDDGDNQPGQFVIHRIIDARVAAPQQGPFHRADGTGRNVGGSHRERVMRFDLARPCRSDSALLCAIPYSMMPVRSGLCTDRE